MIYKLAIAGMFVAGAAAQHVGMQTEEVHLKMPIKKCIGGACVPEATVATIDSNWRWTHKIDTTYNCYTGDAWNETFCATPEECTANCGIDGVSASDWKATYGITGDSAGAINISFVTNGTNGVNVGARMYLLETEDKYKNFQLLNKEFTFDVDASNLPCGVNGALYFVEMDQDGGKAKFETNEAGAKYGTGYCDAQCPHDLKWINGEANSKDWNGTEGTAVGRGHYGTCCAELDIWEANNISTQMTVHGCTTEGQHRCEGVECGDNDKGERFKGVCDKDGCDYNPYRVGAVDFYGPGDKFAVNSLKPMTVVTQFKTADGTDTGDLVEMSRFYIQDGKKIENPAVSYGKYTSLTDEMCTAQKSEFGDYDDFTVKGGMKAMGEAMGRGMQLVLSLWDDIEVGMIWLDAIDPAPKKGEEPGPGDRRGTCSQDSGKPEYVEKNSPHAHVIYSDIKYGAFGSTYLDKLSPSERAKEEAAFAAKAPKEHKHAKSATKSAKKSACPSGSLSECIGLCPAVPASAYKTCVSECASRCVDGAAAWKGAPADALEAKLAAVKAKEQWLTMEEKAATMLENELQKEIASSK